VTKGHIAGTSKNCPFPVGVQDHHLIHGSLDPSESTAERHLNWFSYFSTSCRYVQQTDRPLNTGNSRPHLCIPCMRCSLITHTHAHLTALFPGLPGWAGTRKIKPIWILLKQETVSGSGISWAICTVCTSLQTDTYMPAPHACDAA